MAALLACHLLPSARFPLRCVPPFRELVFAWGFFIRRLYCQPDRMPSGTIEGYSAALASSEAGNTASGVLETWLEDLEMLKTSCRPWRTFRRCWFCGRGGSAVYLESAEPLREYFRNCEYATLPGVRSPALRGGAGGIQSHRNRVFAATDLGSTGLIEFRNDRSRNENCDRSRCCVAGLLPRKRWEKVKNGPPPAGNPQRPYG